MIKVREIETRQTTLGEVRYIKVCGVDYQPLSWDEIWAAFAEAYPGKWAVQMFPPAARLVNGKCMYHLFVCESDPMGLDIR